MTDTYEEITQALKEIDREMYTTLSEMKETMGEIYIRNLFTNPELSDLAKDCLEQADITLKGIRDEHRPNKNTENRQIHSWLN